MHTGALYLWGEGKYGNVGGDNNEDVYKPVRFRIRIGKGMRIWFLIDIDSKSAKICQVSCGARFTCAISGNYILLKWTIDNGYMFSWGCNQYGQLGLGSK